MCRIYNPEWLKPTPYDNEPDDDDELSPMDDDYIPEDCRDTDND